MSFFIRGKRPHNLTDTKQKKKSHGKRSKKEKFNKATKSEDEDEEIESDDEDIAKNDNDLEESEDEIETAQEKKLRLAKIYLQEIEREEHERSQREVNDDVIGERLKEQLLEKSGQLRKEVADRYSGYTAEKVKVLRCNKSHLSITSVVLTSDNKFLFFSSKDGVINKWCMIKLVKLKYIKVNDSVKSKDKKVSDHILSLSVSTDSKFVASGGKNKLIHIWSIDLEPVHIFHGHKDVITGLVFRRDSYDLYSASSDRTVKVWNLNEMTFVESLFGHQSGITAIDALSRERAVTSGGRDNSVRIWKIVESSQLIYNGHVGSIDGIKLINEDHFISCGDDGQLCIWRTMKKKPISSVNLAHGSSSENKEPNWITSIAALLNTDLIASGSRDGNVKVWKCGNDFRSMECIFTIPVVGFVNSLAFSSDGSYLVIGVGQEHRLGRWWRIKEARNSVVIVPLVQKPDLCNNIKR